MPDFLYNSRYGKRYGAPGLTAMNKERRLSPKGKGKALARDVSAPVAQLDRACGFEPQG